MKRTIALVILVLVVLGMAHSIELTARPDTGRRGVKVAGEEGHAGHGH